MRESIKLEISEKATELILRAFGSDESLEHWNQDLLPMTNETQKGFARKKLINFQLFLFEQTIVKKGIE